MRQAFRPIRVNKLLTAKPVTSAGQAHTGQAQHWTGSGIASPTMCEARSLDWALELPDLPPRELAVRFTDDLDHECSCGDGCRLDAGCGRGAGWGRGAERDTCGGACRGGGERCETGCATPGVGACATARGWGGACCVNCGLGACTAGTATCGAGAGCSPAPGRVCAVGKACPAGRACLVGRVFPVGRACPAVDCACRSGGAAIGLPGRAVITPAPLNRAACGVAAIIG